MTGIEQFHNMYQGERLFIIGNGPSLTNTPLEELNVEYTLAMNKINLIYPETDWRPSLYFFSNPDSHSYSENLKDNLSLNIPCFINSDHGDVIRNYDNAYEFDTIELFFDDLWNSASIEDVWDMSLNQLLQFWSDNPEKHIYHYHTMYGATQLAVYMGFDKIYFVGCDLGQEYQNPHMIFGSGLDPERYDGGKISYLINSVKKGSWKSLVNAIAYQIIKKGNSISKLDKYFNHNTSDHFVSDYLTDRRIHDGPAVDTEITKAHIATKRICDMKGIETYNATIGGKLDIYPRVDINNLIDGS